MKKLFKHQEYSQSIKIDYKKELEEWEQFGLYLLKTKRFTKWMKPYKMLQRLLIGKAVEKVMLAREKSAAELFNNGFTIFNKKARTPKRSRKG